MKELINIQNNLVVPKNQFNEFGGYKFRSCEDILKALTPLLNENNCFLTIQDTIQNIGDRYYVEATVTIVNPESDKISVTASAREDENKKGMDKAQITGAASSYARKYALSGLFAIDDGADPDKSNKHGKGGQSKPRNNSSKSKGNSNFSRKQNSLIAKVIKSHVFDADRKKWRDNYKLVETREEASAYIDDLLNEKDDRKAAEKQEKQEAENE